MLFLISRHVEQLPGKPRVETLAAGDYYYPPHESARGAKGHESQTSSELYPANLQLLLRKRHSNELDHSGPGHRNLLELPPVLYGQAEAARLGWPNRKVYLALHFYRGRQAQDPQRSQGQGRSRASRCCGINLAFGQMLFVVKSFVFHKLGAHRLISSAGAFCL
jgi:hypothetical protein